MRFTRQKSYAVLALTVSLLFIGARLFMLTAHADKLPDRSVELADARPNSTTTYRFAFDFLSNSSIGSIRIQFCSDTPILDYPCTAPNGLDVSAAVLQSQNGETGFSLGPGTTSNELYLTRIPAVTTPGAVEYVFGNIMNPDTAGTYYTRIQTYASTDASGPWTDGGGLAYAITSPVTISTEVPPYLLLCGGITIDNYDCTTASGDYLNFGELSPQATKSATTSLVLATNAGSGYNLFADGTTMTTGNSVIPSLSSGDVSRPGTSQFGLNLVANSTPAVGNNPTGPGSATPNANYAVIDRYRFNPGELIASAPSVSDYRKFTISYIVNIATNQPPGIYVTTITYVAVASF